MYIFQNCPTPTVNETFDSDEENILPTEPIEHVLWWGGGELMAMCHETTKEERNPPLPGSEVLTSMLRHTGSVLQGVAHSWHCRRMTC